MRKFGLILISLLLIVTFAFAEGAPEKQEAKEPTKLMIWSAAAGEEAQALKAKFNELYPNIEVNIIRSGSGELVTRLFAEQPKPEGDIIMGIAKESLDQVYDLLSPYKTINHDSIGENVRDTADVPKYYGYSMPLQALMVNTDLLKEEDYPKTWKDLINPKYEGEIILANPALSGSAYAQIYMMDKLYGEEFLQKLAKIATFATSSSVGPESVARGEYAITATGEGNIAKYIATGAHVIYVYPEEGTGARFDASGIIANGPNPEAAKLFMDFLTSQDAYEIILTTRNRRVVVPTLPGPEYLPALNDIKLFTYDATEAKEMREELTEKFTEMMM